MPIAVSASSPARVGPTTGSPKTSAGFTAPADSVIVIAGVVDSAGQQDGDPTYSNSGTALTWNKFVNRSGADLSTVPGTIAAALAVVPSSQTFTVSQAHPVSTRNATMKPYLITGAKTDGPLGAVISNSIGPTNTFTTPALVTTGPGSLVFFVTNESEIGAASPTSAGATADPYSSSGNHSGLSAYKIAGAAGSSVTFDLVSTGAAGSLDWHYAVFEILAAPDLGSTGAFFSFFT